MSYNEPSFEDQVYPTTAAQQSSSSHTLRGAPPTSPDSQLSYEELRNMLATVLNDSREINTIRQQFNARTSRGNFSDSLQQGFRVWVRGLTDIDTAEELVTFLESRLKKAGAVARCKLHSTVLQDSNKRTGTATVQFKTDQDAHHAINLARRRKLVLKDSQIEVFPSNSKKAARKRNYRDGLTALNNCVLHTGCLIKKDVLYKLWTGSDSKIEVDNNRKLFRIIVCTSSIAVYKLEWRIRDIYEFCRCRIRGRHNGHTYMLRVWYAPQIFEEYSRNPNLYICEDLLGFSWDDLYEPYWIRTTDFSPEASLGQSYVFCLEVSQDQSGLLDYLIHTVLDFPLRVEDGSSYSVSLLTVPILKSPYMDGLPFELVFLVNSLVQHGYLSGPGLGWSSFFHLISPSRVMPLKHIVHVLEKLRREQDTCFEPEEWFHTETQKFLQEHQKEMLTNFFLDDGLMMVRRVLVTPSRVYCMSPEVDMSNRVTRHFNDHIDDFIRVTFVEEDFDLISPSALVVSRMKDLQSDQRSKVYNHIVSVLNNGIIIGDKMFEFLAFSTSQLREGSVWMFSSNASVTAADIRLWMGDFLKIKNVAKCASRMGQSFSSSTKSLDVPTSEIESIDDIWNADGTYCFSDGIGKISAKFATQVAKKCKLKHNGRIPSLYQIRYGGYKGVVAVDPTSPHKLSLRPSMDKFPSSQISLDILNWSRMLPSYLNREIITLLSTLGVPDSVFENMQEEVIQQLDAMLRNGEVAMDVIQAFCGGSDTHQIIIEMISAGFHAASEPFLVRMLHTFRAFYLMNLRKKFRIYAPKGRLLMGCLDETKTLDYGQAFISVSPTVGVHDIIDNGLQITSVYGINNVLQSVCIVEGPVIVAKNPCVHPGDVRVLTAVDVPALHHLVDCIVFPQKGHRPHPSECSGSDLDGDLYFVSWDTNLIPPEVHQPQDYRKEKEKELERRVTTQDIITYFADYMVNNSLGQLSNAHVVFADMLPEMARHPKCLELARLCAIAVDFPKTGIPAVLPADLRPNIYPNFMEKEGKSQYVSERVLGKLYSAVEASTDAEISPFTKREAAKFYDKQMEVGGFMNYRKEAVVLKKIYDEKLISLMYQYDVDSEAEMFTGNILSLSKWVHRRPGDARERMIKAMSSLKKDTRKGLQDPDEINVISDDDDDDDERWKGLHEQLQNASAWNKDPDDPQDSWLSDDDNYGDERWPHSYQKASAWYHVTYHPSFVPDYPEENYGHLLSFPWVACKQLVIIKNRAWARSQSSLGGL